MSTVILTLTEEQAYTLWDALETYNRLLMGQFTAVTDLFPARDFDRKAAETALKEARQIVMPDLDPRGYYGIKSREIPDGARRAFDVEQVLRYALSWHRYPEGGITANFDEPLWTSPEPRPRAEVGHSSRSSEIPEGEAHPPWCPMPDCDPDTRYAVVRTCVECQHYVGCGDCGYPKTRSTGFERKDIRALDIQAAHRGIADGCPLPKGAGTEIGR